MIRWMGGVRMIENRGFEEVQGELVAAFVNA